MILKSKHGIVIFVHPPRSSGTSIEHCLKGGLVLDKEKHLNATQLKKRVGQNKWDKAFKFGVIRNPWDRMASLYVTPESLFGGINIHSGNNMHTFLTKYKPAPWEHGTQCADYLNESLDFIVCFETRAKDIERLNQALQPYNLRVNPNTIKRKHNNKQKDFMSYFDKQSNEVMHNMFKEDISRWYPDC